MTTMRAREEAKLERAVLLELGRDPTLLLLRNEVGRGFYGALLPALEAAFPSLAREMREISYRHAVAYGLGVGSPDLVGAVGGRMFGLELKSERGRAESSQPIWHAAAESKGVVCGEVRSVADARAVIERARR